MNKAYTINPEKKTITIDDSVKATAADNKDIGMYVAAGYIIRHKSKKRAAAAEKRASSLSNEDILKALESNDEALKKYNAIKTKRGKGGGFFAARKWYVEEYNK